MPPIQAPPPSAGPVSAGPERRPRIRHRLRTPQEARVWRRRVTGYALFAFSFVLMVNALVGENGYLATMRASGEQARLFHEVKRARLRNQAMQTQLDRLRKDPAALEEAARRELNMIKPGETLIVIRDQVPAKPAPPQR